MRASLNIDARSIKDFNASCDATITKVGRNTRKATVEALREISDESLRQVPRDTGTLANSQFWEVTGNYRVGWTGTVGYGGNGNPINPKTGKPASNYMVAVHENLVANHPIGKAKFLEDPLRQYAAENFPRTVIRYVQEALGK